MKKVAVGDRSVFQKYFTDPLVGLSAGLLFLIFKILPLPVARFVGANLGALIGLLMIRRNKIALMNMQIAFPKKTLAERKKILRAMWRHFGRMAAEIFHIPQVMSAFKIKGRENALKFIEIGKGGFFCSAHLGNWEMPFDELISPDCHINPVFRTGNNPYLNKMLFDRRKGVHIPKGPAGARLMLQVLKEGQFVSILCDQKFREGLTIPFWGMPAQTATAIATLAIKLDVPILMARSIWKENKYYELEILEPLKVPVGLPREQAEYEIMSHINKIYEKWITETPEQWLWLHRRFRKEIYQKKII